MTRFLWCRRPSLASEWAVPRFCMRALFFVRQRRWHLNSFPSDEILNTCANRCTLSTDSGPRLDFTFTWILIRLCTNRVLAKKEVLFCNEWEVIRRMPDRCRWKWVKWVNGLSPAECHLATLSLSGLQKSNDILATIEFDGVSKTLTHHRIHLKCSKISQMNPSTHSFQNMC